MLTMQTGAAHFYSINFNVMQAESQVTLHALFAAATNTAKVSVKTCRVQVTFPGLRRYIVLNSGPLMTFYLLLLQLGASQVACASVHIMSQHEG